VFNKIQFSSVLTKSKVSLSLGLADRAYATALRQSSVCTEYIVAKRCVLEQRLLLTAY